MSSSSRRATVNAGAGRPPSSRPSQSSSSTAALSTLNVTTTREGQDVRSMSSKRPSVSAATKRYAPYNPSDSSRTSGSLLRSSQASRPSGSSQSSSATALAALGIPTTKPGQDLRDIAQQMIDFQFPGFRPRNDFELMTLASRKYTGTRANLGSWLDEQLAWAIGVMGGSLEAVMEVARTTLAMPSTIISGLKPSGMEHNVFVRPIPNSSYSIRLFPGHAAAKEYCLDFVDNRTGLPVNSPFKFELFGAPNTGALPGFRATPMMSLDRAFGVPQDQIRPGHEKFLLMDGMTCVLRRPGHKDVRFTVPTRRQPPIAAAQAADDVDEIDLPTDVDP